MHQLMYQLMRQLTHKLMHKRRWLFMLQLAFTLLICAFLIVPVILSILAGLTVNYLVGIESGLTLRWVVEVWDGYRETIFASIGTSSSQPLPITHSIAPVAKKRMRSSSSDR